MIQHQRENLIRKLRNDQILNERIMNIISKVEDINQLESIVNKYIRYKKAILQINDKCQKLHIQFDLKHWIANIDYCNKKVFDEVNQRINKIAMDEKSRFPTKKEYKGSIHAVSGGLPSLGKRR